MYIVAIAWMFVVVLMSATEATSTQGSLLGALITFILYGVIPLAIVLYIMGTPARRQARLAAERTATPYGSDSQGTASAPPDGRRVPAGDPVAPEREKA